MTGSDVRVRPVREADFPALAGLDLTYESRRVLSIQRSGGGAELDLALRWRPHGPVMLTYAEYPADRQGGAVERTDAFLIAEIGTDVAGLLMIVIPRWPGLPDTGEITDLAVGREFRGCGIGRALVDAAAAFARERGLRALWVEPRTDNDSAIEFYVRLGFRIAGFNDRMYSNEDHEDGRTTLLMYLDLAPGASRTQP